MKISIIQNVSINDHRMVHTDGIARELIRRGHEVEVIIQRSNEKPQFNNFPYDITYIPGDTYSILGQLKFVYGLLNLLKKRKYDIIHAKNPFSSIIPVLLKRSGANVIYDIRGLWVDFGVHAAAIGRFIAPFLNWLDILCMKRADRVISISHEMKRILVNRGIEEEKIEVIVGDGVDVEKIRNIEDKDVRDFLGIEGKVVGYIGSIDRSRYSEKVIEAFDFVHREIGSEVKFVMIGPIRDELYFQNLIKEKGLVDHLFFTGFLESHDEVLQLLKSFDIVVSYHQEDLPCFNVMVPTKVLEYLAAGGSIVATDHKSHRSLLTNGKDSYLTEQNPKSFAEGIIHVLEDEELSKRISKNALVSAEKLSFKKVTDNIEKIYKTLRDFNNG